MTSLAETYLSCKTAFANKLVSKGVSASSDDGLTTLIGKIDDIGDSFDTGILLSADKSVEQEGTTQSPNTINLSALVLENGNFKPGATVLLYESILDKTYTAGETLNLSIGSDWEIDLGTGANIWLCANGATIAGGDYILSLAGNYLTGYGGGGYVISPRELPGNGKLRLKNGVLYFGNSSLDLSSYNFTLTNLNKVTEAGSVKVFTPTSLTTNSNGIATKSYTCTGVGKKEFYATCGTLQSEPYEVLDALFYDTCVTGTTKTSTWFIYNNSVSTPVVSDDGMFVERTSTGNGYLVCNSQNMNTKPFALDFAVEFDVVSISGDVRFTTVDGDWQGVGSNSMTANSHIKVEYYSNKQIITINDGTPTEYTKTNSGNQGVRFQFVGVGSIKIKDFKVYSI